MFDLLLYLCDDSRLLRVIYIIKIIISVICIAVPIILIVTVMLDFIKTLTSSNEKDYTKAFKKSISRLVLAIVVLLVPTIVTLFLNILNVDGYEECLKNITIDKIKEIENKEQNEKETINEPVEDKKQDNNRVGVIVTIDGESYFTSSKTGIRYTLYNQSDARWASLPLNGKTFGETGCSATSSAVLASGVDNTISPITVINKGQGNAYSSTAVPLLTNGKEACEGPIYVSGKSNTDVKNEVVERLKNGYTAVIQTTDYKSDFINTDSHYMALLDYKSETDEVFIGNSFDDGLNNHAYGWFDANKVISGIKITMYCKIQ